MMRYIRLRSRRALNHGKLRIKDLQLKHLSTITGKAGSTVVTYRKGLDLRYCNA